MVITLIAGVLALGALSPSGAVVSGEKAVKIGIITDLSGPAAYWGESTRVGAELAVADLEKEGIIVDLLFEDYKFDSKNAVTSAQKLVELDGVDALYVEFNPATIPVAEYAKDKDVIYVLDSAAVSVVNSSPRAFKTYVDFEAGCKGVARMFKADGVERLGMLKGSLEAYDVCLRGARQVYPDIIVENYNTGDADLSTQVLKLNASGAGAVLHPAFEGETLSVLKTLRTQGIAMRYASVDEVLTPAVRDYAAELEGGYAFGFRPVSAAFRSEIDAQESGLSTYNGAGLAYTHVRQLGRALAACNGDRQCAAGRLSQSASDSTIGFERFEDRIARFELKVAPISEFG